MERYIAGIIRWMERCLKAYNAGSLESAFMDAECARADMERLRDELWTRLERRHSAKLRRRRFFRPAEVVFCAVSIMLATATPLTVLQDGRSADRRGDYALEWVTPDERVLLSNIRKRPENSLALTTSADSIVPVLPRETSAKRKATDLGAPRKVDTAKEPPQEARKREMVIPYDQILSLVETGERAMKNSEPAIKVENASGKGAKR
jgi:hypothetical protein